MTIGKRIKNTRLKTGMSQVDFASKINVSKQTLYKYENGIITNIPSDKIEAIAKFGNVSPAYLMGWNDTTPSRKSISIPDCSNVHPVGTQTLPMLGNVACGTPIYMNEDRESYVLDGTEIDADFCLTAKGDSMINARIYDGDIVFIRKQDMVENGEIAAVAIGDEATLKRFFYYREKSLVILKAENPVYEDLIYQGEEINSIHILGKAIAFQSDVK